MTYSSSALAWGPTGHLVTAQLAYEELDSDTRSEVDRLIALLAPFEPRFDHFVPASTWMDALRSEGPTAFDHWHYINLPIGEGLDEGEWETLPGPDPYNAVWAIRRAVEVLSDADADDLQKAWMLRVLVHLVGDVHQPLHTVSRFGEGFSRGDRGGNLFTLRDPEHSNLHRLWDWTAGLLPFVNPEGRWQAPVQRFAQQLRRDFAAPGAARLEDSDPGTWAEEGRHLAKTAVYAGIDFEGYPSEAYLARARGVIGEQLLLGGFRLAGLLNTALGKK
ncbi:MAG: S1/P1 nuclease [Deltaproteobacteria bacterium]|nr:S1/P1 nuclease [Deltaproteobacteria bacterium]